MLRTCVLLLAIPSAGLPIMPPLSHTLQPDLTSRIERIREEFLAGEKSEEWQEWPGCLEFCKTYPNQDEEEGSECAHRCTIILREIAFTLAEKLQSLPISIGVVA